MKLLVINGPNLNMLGYTKDATEGDPTLTAMDKELATYGAAIDEELELIFYQTNHEGQLIDMVQKAHVRYDALIFNPSSLCHYAYALRDAVEGASLPVVEVQLEDISKLEAPQNHSIIGEVCSAQFMGKQLDSYKEAVDFLLKR